MYNNARTHLVIDMLNDFISGSLPCLNAENALNFVINYINQHPKDTVLYVCDSHPVDHSSFEPYGGQWPPHCVKNTSGQEIHLAFYTRLNDPVLRPHLMRIYRKGTEVDKEEYSGFNARRTDGQKLQDALSKTVVISGIATEYCVLNTVKDLIEAGYTVQVLAEGLAYVNQKDHKAALDQMKSMGAKLV